MGRMYSAAFQGVSVSTGIVDLFELLPAAGKPCIIHSVHVTQDDGETSLQLPVTLKRLTATVTGGNGTAVTPRKLGWSTDAAAGAAVERIATTPATTSGTAEVLRAQGDNILNGWHWTFLPEERIGIVNGEAFIAKLETAAGVTLLLSGELIFEELG